MALRGCVVLCYVADTQALPETADFAFGDFSAISSAPLGHGHFLDPEISLLNMTNEKKAPGCLGYIGDYTAQWHGVYHKPL